MDEFVVTTAIKKMYALKARKRLFKGYFCW